LNYYGFLFTK